MIQPEGQIDLKCSVNNKSTQLTFQVVSLNASPNLGKDASVDLGLIQRIEVNSVD